jgi:surface protein
MFLHHDYLEKIPLFDTSNVTKMNNMFDECHNLKTIPLFDTSNVIDMSYMFYCCCSLTSLPLLDISNINYIQCVLHGCTLIPTIEKLKFYIRIKKDAFLIKTIQLNHNSFSKRQLLNILAEYE